MTAATLLRELIVQDDVAAEDRLWVLAPALADALEAAEATTGPDSTEDWEAVDAKALRSLRSALAVVAAQLQGERA